MIHPTRIGMYLHKLRKATRLSLADWMIMLQAWLWLLLFDLGLRTFPFPGVQAFAAGQAARSFNAPTANPQIKVSMVMNAVDHARNYHLYPMTCLRRALTMQKMLALRGIATELKIGVRKDAQVFSAHAWLEYQGQPLGEPEKITERYATLKKA